jgi:hypothetical protein
MVMTIILPNLCTINRTCLDGEVKFRGVGARLYSRKKVMIARLLPSRRLNLPKMAY